MNTITLTEGVFGGILQNLRANSRHVAACEATANTFQNGIEIICGPARFLPYNELRNTRHTSSCLVEVSLSSLSFARSGWRAMWLLALRAGLPDQLNQRGGVIAQVTLDKETGNAGSGFVALPENVQRETHDATRGQFMPVHRVKIVGASMKQILTVDANGSSEITAYERERWSRAMGALGGIEVWERFVTLRFCIIGVGRSGSLFAQSLTKAGVRHLTLIDPDRVELHNLDAMDCVAEGDLGQFKVDAIQSHLQRAASMLEITSVAGSALSEEAWEPMTKADVLISCVDNNAARLLVGGVASVYSKPLLDVGTGIFGVDEGRTNVRMGADVRLIVPGDGCLLCVGGIRDPQDAVAALREEVQGIAAVRPPWQAQRTGSLRSLNETAVHLGLGLLENLVAGKLNGSTWLRLEYGETSIPRIVSMPVRNGPSCPFCHRARED